jgi:DNA-binding response OmpR family regulator
MTYYDFVCRLDIISKLKTHTNDILHPCGTLFDRITIKRLLGDNLMKNILILTSQPHLFKETQNELQKELFLPQVENYDVLNDVDFLDHYQMIIFDLLDKDSDNIRLMKNIQEITSIPFFVTSHNDSEIIKSFYLNQGADGYLTHPIKVIESVALIKAVYRRIYNYENEKAPKVLTFGTLEIYPDEYRVYNDGVEVNLTVKEFALLKLFVENSDATVSRERISDFIYRMEQKATGNAINIHINRLRKKLSQDDNESFIETVWGIGYRLSNFK